MKSFITAVIIAAMLAGGGIALNMCISGISERMEDECGEILRLIEEGDYAQAKERAAAISEYIENKKIVLASTLNHENIDDIELCITELESYTENKIFAESIMRCKKLKHLFRHLPANYAITAENIL